MIDTITAVRYMVLGQLHVLYVKGLSIANIGKNNAKIILNMFFQ